MQVAAQSTIAAGSIQGTLTDSSGAVVPGAQVTITNKDTAQKLVVTSTSTGTYNSGALVPGNYLVRAEVKGFNTLEQSVVVRVGEVSGVNLVLHVGTTNVVVKVAGETVAVLVGSYGVVFVCERKSGPALLQGRR
jgi:Carboxypeptidase regulatory-like domain